MRINDPRHYGLVPINVEEKTFTGRAIIDNIVYYIDFDDGFLSDKESPFFVIRNVYRPIKNALNMDNLDNMGEKIDVMICARYNLVISKYSSYIVENFDPIICNVSIENVSVFDY